MKGHDYGGRRAAKLYGRCSQGEARAETNREAGRGHHWPCSAVRYILVTSPRKAPHHRGPYRDASGAGDDGFFGHRGDRHHVASDHAGDSGTRVIHALSETEMMAVDPVTEVVTGP
jgi:hypothetical protein